MLVIQTVAATAVAPIDAHIAAAARGTQRRALGPADMNFAVELIACIRELAAEVAGYSPPPCATAEEVLDERAELVGRILAPYLDKYGQAAALWCAVYATPQCAAPRESRAHRTLTFIDTALC